MQMTKRKESDIPEPSEPPRVGQVSLATGEGNSMDVEVHCDDDAKSDGGGQKPSCRGSLNKKRKIINIGTWNVLTMKELGKLDLLLEELDRSKMNITGLSETRWNGEGLFQYQEHTIIHCGNDKGERGVAIILDRFHSKTLKSFNAISDRMLTVKLNTKPTPTNIIQVYAPTSASTEEEIDMFYEQLQTIKSKIPKREICIIMGDFNAKVGEGEEKENGIGPYGLGNRNERGDMLADFCHTNSMSITNTMFRQPKRRRYTWKSPGELYRNQIDYILIDSAWTTSVINAKSKPGADCDTDHILVTAQLRIKAFKTPPNNKPTRYDLSKLQDPSIKEQYQLELANRFTVLENDWSTNESCPNVIWEDIKIALRDTANSTLGKAKKKLSKPFISEEVRNLAKAKSDARKNNQTDEYKRLKREIRRKIRIDKIKWLEEECAKITEANIDRKSKEVYNQIRKVTSSSVKPQNMALNDKNAVTLNETEDVLNRWHEYGKELFQLDKNTQNKCDSSFQYQDPEPKPLLSEVKKAIEQLKDGKSPGLDNIPGELLKNAGDIGVSILHKLCCQIWTTRVWPKDWKIQEFVMLHKSGSTKECGNYRTIALISHASKILLIIILNRMKMQTEYELSDCQAGYRPDRGTRDMLFILQVMLEKIKNCSSKAFITFIDYSKAFDSVIHQNLFSMMKNMGFPNHLVSLIEQLYTEQKATIRWGGKHCPTFNIEKGVRQGCILSPHLFNLYTEQVMRNSEIDDMGIKIGGRDITNLRYADDTALVSDNITSMKRIIHRVDTAGNMAGLKLNAKKTKVMCIGSNNENVDIHVNGVRLEQVNEFKYLGSIKTNDGSCTKDIKTRISMAKKRMVTLNTIWKDRNIPMGLKMNLMKSLVWPVMMYGCESWTLKQQDEKRINAAEMWLYRRLLRISWMDKITNIDVLKQLGTALQIIKAINKRRLKYVGHAFRNNKTDLMATVLEGKVEAKRRRGRPSVSFIGNLTEMTGMSLHQIARQTRNRDEWRRTVHCISATTGTGVADK